MSISDQISLTANSYLYGCTTPTERFDFTDSVFRSCCAGVVVHHHIGPCTGQFDCTCSSDISPTASDNGILTREIKHGIYRICRFTMYIRARYCCTHKCRIGLRCSTPHDRATTPCKHCALCLYNTHNNPWKAGSAHGKDRQLWTYRHIACGCCGASWKNANRWSSRIMWTLMSSSIRRILQQWQNFIVMLSA